MPKSKIKITIRRKGLIDVWDRDTYRFFKQRDREQVRELLYQVRERGEIRLA